MDNKVNSIGFINPKHKDSLFRMLFGANTPKSNQNLLDLYNALNNSNYTNVSDLELYTLEDAIYINYKNDVSFIINEELNMYEHQSSINPNMPLRGLIYAASEYTRYLNQHKLDPYSSKLIKIPTPKYVVLYNGKATYPEKSILKLSDMFFKNENTSSCEYEWTATVLNINNGMNDLLKNACLALRSYADFVSLIRYNKDILHQNNQDAIENAINYTLQKKDALYEILSRSKAEVTAMFLSEFNQEVHNDNLKAEGREEGRAEGLAEGLADKLKSLAELVNEGHIPYDVALRKANVPEEEFKKYL